MVKIIDVVSSQRKQWEHEHFVNPKNKSCGMPVKGFRNHVTTDGSLLEVAGGWGACGWSVVQQVPLYGMDGNVGCWS